MGSLSPAPRPPRFGATNLPDGTSKCAVFVTPHDNLFSLVRFYQVNEHGDENPLGVVVAGPGKHCRRGHKGKTVRRVFPLEPDTVSVGWEVRGKQIVQTVAGIPKNVGALEFISNFGNPDLIEVLPWA